MPRTVGLWPRRKLMGVQRGFGLGAWTTAVYLKIDGITCEQVELNGVLYNAAHPSAFISAEPMFFTTG